MILLVPKRFLIIEQVCVHLLPKENGQENLKKKYKFIYLISPNKIYYNFYKDLKGIFQTKKIKYFQLRLKQFSPIKIIKIANKIKKICKSYKVKFIINDNPLIARKVGADGCHLGQTDLDINEARKIIKNKIIGSTEILPVAIVHPITGGNAPAAPPITIFCGVFLFNQIV